MKAKVEIEIMDIGKMIDNKPYTLIELNTGSKIFKGYMACDEKRC